METIQEYGEHCLELGYHGTCESNLPSIFAKGLCVPGRSSGVGVANGSALGVGVYLTPAGEHVTSQGYLCGSSKMLVCGIIDPTLSQPSGADLDCTPTRTAESRRFVWRGGCLAHRVHRRPAAVAAAAAEAKEADGRRRGDILKAGCATVVFQDKLVAPLFVADPAGPYQAETSEQGEYLRRLGTPSLQNRKRQPPMLGKRRCWDSAAEQGVWLIGSAERDRCARELKRRLHRKLRNADRATARAEKLDLCC